MGTGLGRYVMTLDRLSNMHVFASTALIFLLQISSR